MLITNELKIMTRISGIGNKDCPTSLNKDKLLQFLNLQPSLQDMVLHKWRLNGTFHKYFGFMEPIKCFYNREENWGPVYHGIESANRVSKKYPHIKLALFFHDMDLITMKKTKWANHSKAAATHARYMMQKLGFSNAEIWKVEALIRFHHYHLSKDMRSFRKLCMEAFAVDPDFDYKDFIRFKLADIDHPKQFKLSKSLLKKTLRYMRDNDPVYTRLDLDIDVIYDIKLSSLPHTDRDIGVVLNRLMNYIAYHGYEHNNKSELMFEVANYLNKKYGSNDSRVMEYDI